MSTLKTTYDDPTLGGTAIAPDRARELLGQVMGRDLSSWARPLFWALLGLIVFGIVAILVSIPNADRAVLIASSILLVIFNVLLLVLDLLGGRRD